MAELTFPEKVDELERYYIIRRGELGKYNENISALNEEGNYPIACSDVIHDFSFDAGNDSVQLHYPEDLSTGIPMTFYDQIENYYKTFYLKNVTFDTKDNFYDFCIKPFQNQCNMTSEMEKEIYDAGKNNCMNNLAFTNNCSEVTGNKKIILSKIHTAVSNIMQETSKINEHNVNKGSAGWLVAMFLIGVFPIILGLILIFAFRDGLGSLERLTFGLTIGLGAFDLIFFGIKYRSSIPEHSDATVGNKLDAVVNKYSNSLHREVKPLVGKIKDAVCSGVMTVSGAIEQKYNEIYYDPFQNRNNAYLEEQKKNYTDAMNQAYDNYMNIEGHISLDCIALVDKLEEPERDSFFTFLRLRSSEDAITDVYTQCKSLENNRKLLEESKKQTEIAHNASLNAYIHDKNMERMQKEHNDNVARMQEEAAYEQQRALERMEHDNYEANREAQRTREKALKDQKKTNAKISSKLDKY